MDHDLPFDPTYGYDRDALLKVRGPEPRADFERFWRQTYEEAVAVPPHPALRRIEQGDGLDVHEIEFDAWGDVRLGGWLTVPSTGEVQHGIVHGHGYGGRDAPDLSHARVPGTATATLFLCARGFHRSARADLPDNAAEHVVFGIESRETYMHRGCAADLWAGASALLALYPQLIDALGYIGGSYGGGIGALALPWDTRFRQAALRVPSFGHHPLRVTLPCTGSGESVRRYIAEHPQRDVLDVLAYFDAASAARWLTIPTLCECALFDPAVPPPGQFAVYNAITGPRRLLVRKAGHFEYAGQADDDRRLFDATAAWFTQGQECLATDERGQGEACSRE